MSNAVVGALRVTLGLDSAAFENGLDGARKQLATAGANMQKVGSRMAGIGAGMSVAITAPFIALGAHLLQGSQDAAHAAGQVNAALTSMGGASGKTADELFAAAEAMRNLTGVDDDEILTKVTANLLTFGNVSGEAFDRAQMAALDLAARMQGDLQGATMMIGKALNDPVKGLAALGRAGIQFTEQQKEQIKSMVAAGDAAGAQAIMLGELEKQFGGAAKAAGDADVWKPLKTALMDLEGAFEPLIRDVMAPLVQHVGAAVKAFAALSPTTQKFIAIGAAVAAAIGPILVGFGAMVSAVGAITAAFAGGGFLAGILPFLGPIGIGVAAVTAAFVFWGDDIIPILKAFGKQIGDVLGPKVQPLFDAVKGAVGALGDVFAAVFAGGGDGSATANLQTFGTVVSRVLGAAVDLITGAVNVITNVLRALAALLRGDFSAMWNALGSAVKAVVVAIGSAFETLFPNVSKWVRATVEGVRDWLVTRFQSMVVEPVKRKIDQVSGFFFGLYDAVVGHSYIPDMVEGVAAWMAKLDAGMVVPAKNATAATKSAFEQLRDDVAAIIEGLMTDAEKAERDLQNKLATIRKGVAAGQITPELGQRLEGGVIGEGLAMPEVPRLDPTKPLIDPDAQAAMNSLGQSTQQMGLLMQEALGGVMDATSSLADGLVNLALTGEGSLGDLLASFIATVAKIIIEMLALKAIEMVTGIPVSAMIGGGGGARGGMGDFFGNLLGFQRGGSFSVGGSGTADSKLVAFRATPGERVDISTKGQQRDTAGGATAVHVVPSRYFDVQVQKVATPLVAQGMARAVQVSGQVIPAQQGRRARNSFGVG